MSYHRRLQQPAVPAHMTQPRKKFRIAPSLMGAVQEAFHSIQRTALVHLNVRVQIVGQRQIGIQAKRRLKRFIGRAQSLE
jgi:hypothetical protein